MVGTPVVALALALATQQPSFEQPAVSVERVLVDARVLDAGRAVRGLGPRNFEVRIDGESATVVSVTWISAEEPVTSFEDDEGPGGASPELRPAFPAPGRLVVLFFQKEQHPTRTSGLLRLLAEARQLVRRLGPQDRAAVLSFDSHLKLWQDFTGDAETLDRALARDVIYGDRAPLLPAGEPPSLAAHLDPAAARDAASPETALLLIGEALGKLGGSKTLVFMGHGLGELSGPRVAYHGDYGAARRALLRASTSVFTLDVTDADQHTLEVGLQQIAAETGGFYARTHDFAGGAMARLDQALEGHYVLEVAHPGGPRGQHELDVALVDRDGEVFARRMYFD